MNPAIKAYLRELGGTGGRNAVKRLGKKGLSARAKRGWITRKARKNGKRRVT